MQNYQDVAVDNLFAMLGQSLILGENGGGPAGVHNFGGANNENDRVNNMNEQ